jgi:hypothetical protein
MPKNLVPSFAYKVRESMQRQRFLREQLRSYDLVVRALDHKLTAYRFVQGLGFQVPQQYGSGMPLAGLGAVLAGLDSVVIKPIRGKNSWGVLGLSRVDQDHFIEVCTNTLMTTQNVLDQQAHAMTKYKMPNSWMIEELLLPADGTIAQVDDLKFYAFYGKIGCILQRRRTESQVVYKWYDPDWNITETGKYEDRLDQGLPPPRQPQALSEVVETISRSIPKPFMRIDMYNTSRGPVFGEFTPHPGHYDKFSDAFDEYLGTRWEEAEAQLHDDMSHGRVNVEPLRKLLTL